MDAALIGDVIISNISGDTFLQTISEVGQIGNWLQALGVIAVLWIIFQIVSLVLTLNKMRILNRMLSDLQRLEAKMDKKLDLINKRICKK